MLMVMTFKVLVALKLKTQRGIQAYRPGDTFRTDKIDSVRGLLESQKIVPAELCHICHGHQGWWLSVYGVLTCNECHPPAALDLVKMWFTAAPS